MSRSANKIRIYFPSQYPKKISPAQRYRIEQFEDLLLKESIIIDSFPFIGENVYPIFFKPGFLLRKMIAIATGFLRRLMQLFILYKYDLIFINREASPLGPPVFEWLYAKVFQKKIIYDFDDAIWLSTTSEVNKIAHGVKCFWKIKYIIKWSTIVTAGNEYLCNYARRYNKNTILLPTVVDTATRFNKTVNQNVDIPTIGWTGSFSTMPYLEKLIPALENIATTIPYRFILISNKKPEYTIPNMEYVEWSEENEISKLVECQVGLMPMLKDEWALGKCGFKIIQYMALGIVPLADAWGANLNIVKDGVDGMLIHRDSEWESKLKKILTDFPARETIAAAAQQTARDFYSVQSVFPRLFSVIQNTAGKQQ